MTIEEQVNEIVAEVKAQAQAGTLTPEVLAVGMMALQDFKAYLDSLVDAELVVSDAGTALENI